MVATERVRDYWNSRAQLGATAGTQDRILKRLEIEEIARHVRPGMRVLDVGCGNGETAITLADRFEDVRVWGFDYAPALVDAANAADLAAASLGGERRCHFVEGAIGGAGGEGLPFFAQRFDLVYTERCLINLPDWETQREAIHRIAQWVKPGGYYLMVESSQDALDLLNDLREQVRLPRISAPWHNRYLLDRNVYALSREQDNPFWPVQPQPSFTGTYYFLSRVVNASLAAQAGTLPDYDVPVNRLAFDLPGDLIPDVGQTKAWLWVRRG